MSTTLNKKDGLPWLMLAGTPSAKRYIKALKEKTGDNFFILKKKWERALGVEKAQEAQKAKAFRKMKAAKDAGEEYCDPEREDNILVRNKTRLALWEEHLKDPIVALDKKV